MAELVPELFHLGGLGFASGWIIGFLGWGAIAILSVINKFK